MNVARKEVKTTTVTITLTEDEAALFTRVVSVIPMDKVADSLMMEDKSIIRNFIYNLYDSLRGEGF